MPAGVPNHAFHVFCVYPWVGLLRSGFADHALEVIDRCRIRWGSVVRADAETAIVESQLLEWDGIGLSLGPRVAETVRVHVGETRPRAGDMASMHWDYLCAVLSSREVEHLRAQTSGHLDLVNRHRRGLINVVEA
ncbi:MAG: DUF6390 family protein [Actinomycetia bacterium]|nr:DUF6390 family protein [Actinomycetes bacterium]